MVCSALNIIDVKLSGQLTVLFCTVLGGISLVKWEGAGSHPITMLRWHSPFEYETQEKQEEWKGRLFRPAGLSRYRGGGEKSRRVSARRINLLARRGRGERHVRPEGRREILRGEWVRKRSSSRDVWPE